MMKYIAYIEIVVGLGLGLGPVIGGLIYGTLYFDGTMYFFGFINTFGLFCCVYFMPNELNKVVTEEEIAKYEAESGTLANGVVIANDSAASGGRCIQNMHLNNASFQINNIIMDYFNK